MRFDLHGSTISRRLFSRRERAFAARGALSVLGAGMLFGAFWLSPWSPGAQGRAGSLAASGQTDRAIEAYLDIAHGPACTAHQREALWQAAWLASVDPHDPQRAVDLMRGYVEAWPVSEHSAMAYERLATLYRLYLTDPVRAAEAWEKGAELLPASPDAARFQLEAGLAFVEAGLTERALPLLEAAAREPGQQVAAQLALGRITLPVDAARAYDHYAQALATAKDPADASLARLGAATALEALDQVDQALAELEGGDPADPALQRRRARLEARERR